MRKKYLSALLFGALLFASAGTFTSCKDYDDDINNLSQRIDQVASDLSDLKTKVDALGGYVENVSFADGVLSVTTGGNTVTYNIPDKTGVNEVTLALEGNNLVLTVDGTATTIELPAAESGEIPEIEVIDGILYINGEAQDLKVDVESNVTIIESTIPGNETYTVMVNGEEVTFAKAFADVRISLTGKGTGYFTEIGADETSNPSYGIHWARATKDIAWDGPKGNIASGTLVVGQTTAAEVTVRPINFDLKAHENELTLVSSTGVVAPAKVVVYKSQDNGPLHSGSRADADITYDDVKQGDYVLGIQLNSDLTDRQVIESFATADGNHNIKYALALDGTVVTDYVFAIDTQLKADTQTKCDDVDWRKFVIGGEDHWEAPTGTHQMTYLDGRIYDMKVEIDPSSQSDANVYGVKINEDGTITAGANAESRRFKLQVTLIDVNGNISETEVIEVAFKQADPAQITELAPMPYTVTPLADKSVVINLGDVFTSLSDEDAIALEDRNNIVWDIEDTDDTFVLTQTNLRALNGEIAGGGITYYSDAACTQEIDANDWNDGEAVKSIKYAKIPVTNYNPFASLGEHLLSIKLYREVGVVPSDPVYKTIKTVNVPVDVQLPAWEALFSQPTQTWDNDTYITRIVDVRGTGANRRAEISMDAYAAVAGSGAIADDITVNYIGANIDGNMINAINGTWDNDPLMIAQQVNANFVLKAEASIADANGNLPAADMTADFQYTIGNVPAFTVKKENVKVHIKSIFEDVTYVWYNKDGNETTGPAELDGVTSTIKGTGSTDSDKKKGLALRFISQNIEIGDLDHATWGQFNVLGLLGGVQDLVAGAPTNRTQIGYEMEATSDGVSAITITKTAHFASPYAQSFITLTPTSGVISDNGGTITLTFTDFLGVKTEVVIPFVKKNL